MTVVAWDGECLAADRQSTTGSELKWEKKKLYCLRNPRIKNEMASRCIVALTGCEADSKRMVDCFLAGGDFKELNIPVEGTDLIVATTSGCFILTPLGVFLPREAPAAFGIGSHFALGAMKAGASAKEAVLLANENVSGCGFGVDVCSLGTWLEDKW